MLQVKYYLGFLLFFYLNNKGSQLKVIATMSVGYDHIDVEAVKARRILIGYTPDVLTDATADLTLLLILGAARRIKEGIQAAEHGQVKKKHHSNLCTTNSVFSGESGVRLGYVAPSSQTRQ